MPVSESVKARVIETINDMKDLSIKKMEYYCTAHP